MRHLLLMRHAKSSWDSAGLEDRLRPLNERGGRVAPLMGMWLRSAAVEVDEIVTSTAVRAHQTAVQVAASLDHSPELVLRDDLYEASLYRWINIVRSLPVEARSVLAIGHNPGIEDLVSIAGRQTVPVPTATIAWLELEIDDWTAFDPALTTTRLRSVWRPKEVL